MKKLMAQFIVTVALSAFFLGSAQTIVAQDSKKEAQREAKNEAKNKEELEQNDLWLAKQESKLVKRYRKEHKLNSPVTARASEVQYYHDGKYVALGYFDNLNIFHPYKQNLER